MQRPPVGCEVTVAGPGRRRPAPRRSWRATAAASAPGVEPQHEFVDAWRPTGAPGGLQRHEGDGEVGLGAAEPRRRAGSRGSTPAGARARRSGARAAGESVTVPRRREAVVVGEVLLEDGRRRAGVGGAEGAPALRRDAVDVGPARAERRADRSGRGREGRSAGPVDRDLGRGDEPLLDRATAARRGPSATSRSSAPRARSRPR